MFTGIKQEALDFLIGIRLNNNESYYKEHLDIYEQAIKQPMRELSDAVSSFILAMDPELDTRYGSVVSRLRRDTRFTQDKSPFRDHVWMGWRYPGERRSEGFHMYWGFSPDWMGWGCGSYGTDKELMDALRARIRANPEEVRSVFKTSGMLGRYQVFGEPYKKLSVPESLPDDLRGLYVMKYFGVEHQGTRDEWKLMQTPEFVDQMINEIHAMTPLIRLMKELRTGIQPTVMEIPVPENNAQPVTGDGAKIVVRSADEFEF